MIVGMPPIDCASTTPFGSCKQYSPSTYSGQPIDMARALRNQESSIANSAGYIQRTCERPIQGGIQLHFNLATGTPPPSREHTVSLSPFLYTAIGYCIPLCAVSQNPRGCVFKKSSSSGVDTLCKTLFLIGNRPNISITFLWRTA